MDDKGSNKSCDEYKAILAFFFSFQDLLRELIKAKVIKGKCCNKPSKSRETHYLSLQLSFLLTAKVSEDFKPWTPALQLHLPVEHHTGGNDDEVRAPVPYKININ